MVKTWERSRFLEEEFQCFSVLSGISWLEKSRVHVEARIIGIVC